MEEYIKHSVIQAGYPDTTGGALDFDAASDGELMSETNDHNHAVQFALPFNDEAAFEDSSDGSSSDEADEHESEEGSDTSFGTDSSSDLTARRSKAESRERKVDIKEEERRRKRRLFREEEDRFQELLETGVGQAADESESDGD